MGEHSLSCINAHAKRLAAVGLAQRFTAYFEPHGAGHSTLQLAAALKSAHHGDLIGVLDV